MRLGCAHASHFFFLAAPFLPSRSFAKAGALSLAPDNCLRRFAYSRARRSVSETCQCRLSSALSRKQRSTMARRYRCNARARCCRRSDGQSLRGVQRQPGNHSEARDLLTHQKDLNALTVRQLKQLLLNAAEGPMTNPVL